jgi:branched-chain amino acid transport system substrate-binding protein
LAGRSGGKPIQVISADHQNEPDIGAAIARQWFGVEHVDAVADLSNSAVGFAVVEVAKPLNKIVLVSGPGSSDFTGKACAPTSIHWTWDTYAAANSTARAIVGPDANTWFFIASDFAFGHALERDGAKAVEKFGCNVVGRVWPPFNNSDFSSYLLQAQQSKASVIAFATGGQDTVNLVKQATEFNLARSGIRIVPMQMMLDEIKAIGLGSGRLRDDSVPSRSICPSKNVGRALFRTDERDANADSGRNLFGSSALPPGGKRPRHR